MSIYKGDKKVAGLGATRRNIGEIVSSILPLTDAGLHLLDGAVISGDGIYGKFVTYIAGLVSSYPNLFITESAWQTSVSTYGVCGKFVYDSTNNTVRLPKITGMIEGTVDVTALGDLVEAGLPNITGTGVSTEVAWNTVRTSTTGAFLLSAVGTNNDRGVPSGNTCTYAWWEFDASLSNPIYGNSNTVQPQTIKAYYYICVAASVKPNIEADMDQIATELNGKAALDLSNVAATSGFRRLIEVYNNGTSWYKVFNEYNPSTGAFIGKWCEQGGRCTATSQTMTFLKPFIDTNYTVTGGLIPGTSSATYEHLNIGSLTTTSFYYTAYDGYQLMWQACGYIS